MGYRYSRVVRAFIIPNPWQLVVRVQQDINVRKVCIIACNAPLLGLISCIYYRWREAGNASGTGVAG